MSKARKLVEKHMGGRPSAHPIANLQVQAKRLRSLAASAARRCHEVEKWDACVKVAEIALKEKGSLGDD
jgi:hypothetical protein